MTKKYMAFILCLLLTLSLTACSGGEIQTSSMTEETGLSDSVPIELEQSDKNTNLKGVVNHEKNIMLF